MLRVAASLTAVLWLGGCIGPKFSRTSAGRVVVPAAQLPGAAGLAGWTPGEEQIASCEAALAQVLAKRKRDLGEYHVRLCGVVKAGGRHIIGIAAHKSTGSNYLRPASEETIVLPAFGGGEAFFRFDYNVDVQKVEKLEFNAAL